MQTCKPFFVAGKPLCTDKGGTCLKKCYFETHRFPEDLYFTLTQANIKMRVSRFGCSGK
ncbi:MAG: nucleotidyl transferase AbiEii/AbiGii toxin family protein [Nitrospirota bacterium]